MPKRTIPPVAADEFKFAFGVCMAAAGKKGPYLNPAALPGFEMLDEKTGEVARYVPTDNGLARATLAVAAQFDDCDKTAAIMMRITAMMQLIDDERMQPYVRNTGNANEMEVREEVLTVTAEEKISGRSGFNAARFFKKIDQLVKAAA